ncbi:MAG: ABC transporter permease [Leptospirales bacterium]|nr:ABC transporter permease [Leptospirales bacterium]
MRSIDRKALRDLRLLRWQAFSIGAVAAAGVIVLTSSLSAYQSLRSARDRFYRQARIADIFADVQRAPESTLERLRALADVQLAESRLVYFATLDMPGGRFPAAANLISLPYEGEIGLNRPILRSGRLPRPEDADEALVSEAFALKNALRPGARIAVLLNGKRRNFRITGVALSAEYVTAIRPGAGLPDDQNYAILWVSRRTLEAAWDMQGSFNSLAIALRPGASPRLALARIDELLKSAGGHGARLRKEIPSDIFVANELDQLRSMAIVLPAIFLGVTAFLLNVVMHRLVARQRDQVATLKALGYDNRSIARHYVLIAVLIAGAGGIAGAVPGYYLGALWVDLYRDFFRFPDLRFEFGVHLPALGALISIVSAVGGAAGAFRQAARLPPAQAMRPPEPASFQRSLAEQLGFSKVFPGMRSRMLLRALTLRPLRTLLAVVGIGFASAVVVVGMFWQDAIDYIVHVQYYLLHREEATVVFTAPVSESALLELQHMPGVIYAEGYRDLPVRLRFGPRHEDAAITGAPDDQRLRRVLNRRLRSPRTPPGGMLLNRMLAEDLGARAGDRIEVETLEGERRVSQMRIEGLVDEFMGRSVLLSLEEANRLAGEGRRITSAGLLYDPAYSAELFAGLRKMPRVSAAVTRSQGLSIFREQSAAVIVTTSLILLACAAVIAFGVVYNTAMSALSERAFELASLRILGFSPTEVFRILAGELAVQTALALPAGALLGLLMAWLAIVGMPVEGFVIPLKIDLSTYMLAALNTSVAAAASLYFLYRRIRRLDLVAVLKVRE